MSSQKKIRIKSILKEAFSAVTTEAVRIAGDKAQDMNPDDIAKIADKTDVVIENQELAHDEVSTFLARIGQEAHILGRKDVNQWSDDDWSTWYSLRKEFGGSVLDEEMNPYSPQDIKKILWNTFALYADNIEMAQERNGDYIFAIEPSNTATKENISKITKELEGTGMFKTRTIFDLGAPTDAPSKVVVQYSQTR